MIRVTMIRRPAKPCQQNHRNFMDIPAHVRTNCNMFLRTIRNNSFCTLNRKDFTIIHRKLPRPSHNPDATAMISSPPSWAPGTGTVTAGDHHIGAELRDRRRQHPDRLDAVDDRLDAALAAKRRQLGQIRTISVAVRDPGDGENPGPAADDAAVAIHRNAALGIGGG